MLLDGAAGSVIEDLGKAGAFAGLIALDRSGEIVAVKNTEFMAVGRCA
jgi:isoaspartyl peptidase/L-asparaginase-like protein (Ntn-hydrolase superfamily)